MGACLSPCDCYTQCKKHASRMGVAHAVVSRVFQASAFIMFPDVYSACRGASVLRDQTAVDAVEMFDRAALR